jgi:hypothetical protein
MHTLTAVAPADVPCVAALYANVFAANPAYGSIFQSSEKRERIAALEWLFARRLQALLAAGNPFFMTRDPASGEVCGAGGVILPGTYPGLLDFLWHGMAAWPLLWGWGSMLRALALDQRLGAGEASEGGAIAHLSMLAVRPESRVRASGGTLQKGRREMALSVHGSCD